MTDPARAPTRREPAFNIPGVVVACCVLLLGIHAGRLLLSSESDNGLIAALAFLPARVTFALDLAPERLAGSYQALVGRNAILGEQVQFLMGNGRLQPWTLATYALLHAGWTHVGFNCIWLVAFGSAVARRFSAPRFLALLLLAAVAGALVQFAVDITSFQLVIGASAAVSGTMGAAVRFVFRPSDEPRRLFDRALLNEPFRQSGLTLGQVLANRVAVVFIVFWFGTDVLSGFFPALTGMGDVPIAWQAHIGGFLAGLLLFPLLDPARPAGADGATVVERQDQPEREQPGP